MWAKDFLAAHPAKKHIINDSWTPSGPFHVGSFRSLIIHDVLRRILNEEKKPVTYHYGFDDFDPLDGVPEGIEVRAEDMGKPLNTVPSPSGKFASFAEEFSEEAKSYHKKVGVEASYYSTSQFYISGEFNQAIRCVLDHSAEIRSIYAEVSGSKKDPNWFPLQVVCPNCGKLGTTIVTGWDGKQVSFTCRPDLVAWAKGCGYQGKTTPFDGAAKMPWRVEWAAKWDYLGVTIESAGKDHGSRGGSYDVSGKILSEVFKKSPPARLPHEYLLLGGKKISSSKVPGVKPGDLFQVMPEELLRFVMVRNRPELALEFDVRGEMLNRLYDEYDRCQAAYLEEGDQDLSDYFKYAQINPDKVDTVRKTRFSDVVNILQLPGMSLELERPETSLRVPYARHWLENYAPEEIKFTVTPSLPDQAKKLSDEQKNYLSQAAEKIDSRDGEKIQADLYTLSQSLGLPAAKAFQAIYLALIGKESGPRAGMLIASQNQDFIKRRFLEASQA